MGEEIISAQEAHLQQDGFGLWQSQLWITVCGLDSATTRQLALMVEMRKSWEHRKYWRQHGKSRWEKGVVVLRIGDWPISDLLPPIRNGLNYLHAYTKGLSVLKSKSRLKFTYTFLRFNH